jgi:hypothetical protein
MAAPLRVLCVLLALVGVAGADGTRRVAQLLATAEAQFEEQEYAEVIDTLRPIVGAQQATRAQRVRALELTALSQLILGDEPAARASFVRLLEIDPDYQLRDDSGSPRIRDFFDEVKREVVPGFDADLVAELDHAAPAEATAGRRMEIDVRATAGGGNVKEVALWLRRAGDLDYREVDGAFRGDGRWRIRVTPEASPEPYTLEYYLEGRGLTGETVARIASPEAPLSIAITAGAGRARRAWYRRWYVWAGLGAALTGTAGVLILTSGTDDGSLDPGRITVTP